MTPQEKAKHILKKYTSITLKEVQPGIFLAFDEELCKKFALIAVDEIIKSEPTEPLNGGYFELHSDMTDEAIKYWQEVKKELEAL